MEEENKLKIIFLDVDGVLINNKNKKRWDEPDPECVAQLNRVIEATGASIVLSSCWRVGRSVVECRELLAGWGVTGKVIDRTPELHLERGCEIAAWLAAYPRDVESFVIIDDDKDMVNLLYALVQTDFREGLTPLHADRVIARLNGLTD